MKKFISVLIVFCIAFNMFVIPVSAETVTVKSLPSEFADRTNAIVNDVGDVFSQAAGTIPDILKEQGDYIDWYRKENPQSSLVTAFFSYWDIKFNGGTYGDDELGHVVKQIPPEWTQPVYDIYNNQLDLFAIYEINKRQNEESDGSGSSQNGLTVVADNGYSFHLEWGAYEFTNVQGNGTINCTYTKSPTGFAYPNGYVYKDGHLCEVGTWWSTWARIDSASISEANSKITFDTASNAFVAPAPNLYNPSTGEPYSHYWNVSSYLGGVTEPLKPENFPSDSYVFNDVNDVPYYYNPIDDNWYDKDNNLVARDSLVFDFKDYKDDFEEFYDTFKTFVDISKAGDYNLYTVLQSILNQLKSMQVGGGSAEPGTDYSSLLQEINASIISLSKELNKTPDYTTILTSLDEIKELLKNPASSDDLEYDYTKKFDSVLSSLSSVCSKLDVITALLGTDVALDLLDDLSEEEQNFVDCFASVAASLVSIFPTAVIESMIVDLQSVFFTDAAPTDLTVEYKGQNIVFLSSSMFASSASMIAMVKTFVSVLLVYGWLLLMRRRLSDMFGG